jgi:HTH-type transcriptional regulator/antitoxin HipB
MDIIRVPDQLGTLLRNARLQKGLTQADVAGKLGVSVQAVSKLENNAGRASFDRVHKLCLLLGLELALQPRADKSQASTSYSRAEW